MNNWLNPYIQLTSMQSKKAAFAAFFGLFSVWSLVAWSGVVSSNMLPAPWEIFNALSYLAWNDGKSLLFGATLSSVARVFGAGILVISIGIPTGILMGASPRINAAMSPLLDPFRSAPIVAFLPLFVMWLGIDETMKIAFLFSGAVVYLIPMTRDAVRAVPQSYWMVARDMGATPFECITKTIIPLAMPRIADAIIVSFSIIWTYITVAEYVNAQSGIGQLIQNARRFSAMDQVCAGILVIVVLALLTNTLMTRLRNKLFSWENTR